MTSLQNEIPQEVFLSNTPHFSKDADNIMRYLNSLNTDELASRISISPALASKARALIYDYPNKSTGCDALHAFTGEVFRGLDTPSLKTEDIDFSQSHLMIVSSLYGLVKPKDIIKPYRLDFNADCSPEGGKLNKFWKSKLTIAFVKHLQQTGEKEVLDLLPGEAAKCLDWKIIRKFAKVIKADFKTIAENGDYKTPYSGKLKELRGKMLRTILTDRIDDFNTLLHIETQSFSADPDSHRPGLPLFVATAG